MHSVDEAAAAIAARVQRVDSEPVALDDARGRILAEPVAAPRALPGFDASAMDGYAVRAAELPGAFAVGRTVTAGLAIEAPIPARAAARIFTGAPLPPELDTVVLQEAATLQPDGAVALPRTPRGENVRVIGEDIAIGELAVGAGARLGAGELGLLAALGVMHVRCARAPRVAILSTGDELVTIASPLAPGQLVDSSSHMLPALVRDAGGEPTYLGIAADDPKAIAALVARALDHDVVLTTGGVSVGDRDYVHAAFAEAGVRLELYKVAMKPGKPFSFGLAGRVPVFGLPGNPVSTFTAFELFVRPALLAMQGAAITRRARVPVAVAGGYAKSAGRAHYLRARVVRDGERLVAHLHAKQGSAMLSSLVGSNALVEIAAERTEVAPGATAPAILLEAV